MFSSYACSFMLQSTTFHVQNTRTLSSAFFAANNSCKSGIGGWSSCSKFSASMRKRSQRVVCCDSSSGKRHGSFVMENEDELEAEMRRLKLELKQTIEMYYIACREALAASQKYMEYKLEREEEKKLEKAGLAEKAAGKEAAEAKEISVHHIMSAM